eukprot:TRINITY_DN14845_c0_g1_i2.p1 TRINITY_DN14845_c0_g1~~TRINITY_DN14845_c0_g1_i2.p1  ORF type:complete len:165 (+),score=30.47 TRINITY_DN14845_c0_g1_i2:85-579(+)
MKLTSEQILLFTFLIFVFVVSFEWGERNDGVKYLPSNSTDGWLETFSWNPRVFWFHRFLSKEECTQILESNEVVDILFNKDKGLMDPIYKSKDEYYLKMKGKVETWTHYNDDHTGPFKIEWFKDSQRFESSQSQRATLFIFLGIPSQFKITFEDGSNIYPEKVF